MLDTIEKAQVNNLQLANAVQQLSGKVETIDRKAEAIDRKIDKMGVTLRG